MVSQPRFLDRPLQLCRIPNEFGQTDVELPACLDIGLLELRVGCEWQLAALDKAPEPGLVLVALRVERTGQQILLIVVRQFLLVSHRAVAGVELPGQQQQPAQTVAVALVVVVVRKLVSVPLEPVGPNVFDLI